MARGYRNYGSYNPYVQGYLAEGNVYQPTYDPSEANRMAQVLQQRQGRYDVARQGLSQFQGQVGAMQTFAPDVLNQQLESFNERVQDIVNTQYGGDFGLAANDVADMIARERQNPVYKMIDYQNQQAQAFQQARLKDPEKFIGIQDPGSQQALQQAISARETGKDPYQYLTADYLQRPDYDELTADVVSRVKPDTYMDLLDELSPENQELLKKSIGEGNVQGIFRSISTTSNKGKLRKLKENLVESVYTQAKRPLQAEFGEGARDEARRLVENMIPQLGVYQEREQLRDLRVDEAKADEVQSFNDIIYGPGKEQISGAKGYEYHNKNFGTDEGKIDLNKPVTDVPTKTTVATKGAIASPGIMGGTQVELGTTEASNIDKYNKAIEEIDAFNQKYGTISKRDEFGQIVPITDRNEMHAAIKDLEDKVGTRQSQYILFDNQTLRNNIEKTWLAGSIGTIWSDQGGRRYEKQDFNSIDVEGKIKNMPREDFEVYGINPRTGRIVVKDKKKGREAEYYPSLNAQMKGSQVEQMYNNIDSKGFSVDQGLFGGQTTLTVRVYDPGAKTNNNYGAIVEYTVPIDRVTAGNIRTQQEAQNLLYQMNDLGYPVTPAESAVQAMMFQNAPQLGFTQAGAIKQD